MNSINQLQQEISRCIEESDFGNHPAELYDPIVYTMGLGGKRIRPTLTLLACDMFKGNIKDAMSPAIAIEVFHNFTLLHDDIMDQSPLRRNQPTVWKKWDENIAILSGDTMLIMAYDYLMKTRNDCLIDILKLFNKTATEVCQGQQYDMNFEKKPDVSIAEYIMMIRLKTAVLVASSLKTGAIIAGASEENAEKLYEFGENVGIAFQLMDDYLDVFGDQEKFGKMTGNDIVTNKKTYLYIKAFDVSDSNTALALTEAYKLPNLDEKIRKVREIYLSLGVDKITLNAIDEYNAKAISLLNSIELEEIRKQELFTFAKNLIKRDF